METEKIDKKSIEIIGLIQNSNGTDKAKPLVKEFLRNFEKEIEQEGNKTDRGKQEIEQEFKRIAELVRTQGDIECLLDLIPLKEKEEFIKEWKTGI